MKKAHLQYKYLKKLKKQNCTVSEKLIKYACACILY